MAQGQSSFGSNVDGISSVGTKRRIGLDRILVGLAVLLITHVTIFSWGVETGKARAERKAEKEMASLEADITKSQEEIGRLRLALESWLEKGEQEEVLTRTQGTPAPLPSGKVVLEAVSVGRKDKAPTLIAGDSSSKESSAVEPKMTAGKFFTVQLATYTAVDQADRQVTLLKNLGYDAFIIPSGRFYQVCTEKLASKELARSLKTRLQSETGLYGDAYVRSVPL